MDQEIHDRFDDVDGYLIYLRGTLERDYTPDQRTLFAASLSERRLAVYGASSQAKSGDLVDVFRRGLDAVWNHVRGKRFSAAELQSLQQNMIAAASQAKEVSDSIRLALDCCSDTSNVEAAVQAARVAYEAALEPAPKSKKEEWQQPAVQSEIAWQQTLLGWVAPPVIDDRVVEFLKGECRAQRHGRGGSFASGREQPSEHAAPRQDAASGGPGMEQLAGALQRLTSFWEGVQNRTLSPELLRALGVEMERSTSNAEKEHEKALDTALGRWSAAQRTAFAAALAERWLQTYKEFSAKEGWGDVERLQGILDAIWSHLEGRKLKRAEIARYSRQVIENAPDTEEYDAPQALATCEILDRALDCCGTKDNAGSSAAAALAACSCYAMMGQGPDYRGDDPSEEERLWQQPAVQAEIARQKTLMQEIGAIASLDNASIQALRRRAQSMP